MKSERHRALRWILVPEAARFSAGATVEVDGEKLKHLRKVLRMEWDERARVTDGAGRLFDARLEKRGDSGAVRLESLVAQEQPERQVELDICLPKNATMDWVVEKAVECGVTSIVPVVSSRSVVKPDPAEAAKYVRRWQAIMDGAVEQSERLWRPLVCAPVSWREWLTTAEPGPARASFAFVSELRAQQDEAQALRHCWERLRETGSLPARVVIGPEGGMSREEQDELIQHGFDALSLGRVVLRVETAAISALTLLRVSRFISPS